jgi:hypothetical protein
VGSGIENSEKRTSILVSERLLIHHENTNKDKKIEISASILFE